MILSIGDEIPEFSLFDQTGTLRTSIECKGRFLVLFFYPKNDTPGCTEQACWFRDKYNLFEILGTVVWGVNNDSESSHRNFAEKNQLQFPLLCDEDNALRRQFGAPKLLGLLDGRITYIIDSKGVIRYIFKELLNGPQHVTESLKVVNEIIHNEKSPTNLVSPNTR